jgi:hypothetical protein
MPRSFSKIIEFRIDGEIYDDKTKPESILNNYDWTFEDSMDGNIQIFAHHKDDRGQITNMTKIGVYKPYYKSDTERITST